MKSSQRVLEAVIENFTFENDDTFDVLLIISFFATRFFYNLKMYEKKEIKIIPREASLFFPLKF